MNLRIRNGSNRSERLGRLEPGGSYTIGDVLARRGHVFTKAVLEGTVDLRVGNRVVVCAANTVIDICGSIKIMRLCHTDR